MTESNRYEKIIESIFLARHTPGVSEVPFTRDDIVQAAAELGIPLPKNLGDVIYSFRYRVSLPETVRAKAPKERHWVIRPVGRAKYCFAAVVVARIQPNAHLAVTKIPDATPGIISKYALNDEQALLAKLRYNRLIDVFTGVTCYSLQNQLRTTAPGMGQVETDEIYIGLDSRGVHYVFPVQAKGGRDALSIVQIEQDFALCAAKFSGLICRPIAAQFMGENIIALFEFEQGGEPGIAVTREKHYRLVPGEDIVPSDLKTYATHPIDS